MDSNHTNIHVMGVSKGRKKWKGKERLFEEIMAKNNWQSPPKSLSIKQNIFIKCPLLLKEIDCNYFFTIRKGMVRKKSTKNYYFAKPHWNLSLFF